MPKTSFTGSAALRARPARAIVRAIADAAERWCDADFPPRVRTTSAIAARLGYTIPVIDYALDRLFGGMTGAALTAAAVAELGSLDALDDFTTVAGRPAAWARGVDAVTIISSDTTIGVAIAPLVFALLAKCAVTVKDRSDALIASFVETLGEELPALAEAATIRSWDGGDDPDEQRLLRASDVVVAFGGSEALLAIRAQCGADATFVPFGHRTSAAYITGADLDDDFDGLAARIARDALLYDGAGCLSLHVLFLQRVSDDARRRFIATLARACAANAIEFPPGPRDARRAAAANAYAHAAAFRASVGEGGDVVRAPDGAWCIVVDPPADDLPPFGGGIIPVMLVDDIAAAGEWITRHRLPVQALGVANDDGDACALALHTGAARITRIGSMQDPPLAGHHGGRARIADFIRWIDRA